MSKLFFSAQIEPKGRNSDVFTLSLFVGGAVVVAQLVERLLPIPEVHGSNPVIGKKIYCTFTVNCIEKTKIKKKRPIKKTNLQRFVSLVTLLGNRHRLH